MAPKELIEDRGPMMTIPSHPHVEVASRYFDPFKAMIHYFLDDLLTLDEFLNTSATFILDDLALMWML